jgi:peroxiredoxin
MRRPLLLATLVSCLALLPACGDEAQAPAKSAAHSSDRPNGLPDEQPGASSEPRPYREVIDAAVEAKVRERTLAARDTALAVGEQAPEFDAFQPGKPNIVVFYRGHWWPWCRKQLGELQDALDRIDAAGATLVAISGDSSADAAALVARLGLTFPVISDVDLRLSAAFGVRQEGKDSPLPATFIIDGERRVTWSAVGDNIVNRPSIDDTLAHLRWPSTGGAAPGPAGG